MRFSRFLSVLGLLIAATIPVIWAQEPPADPNVEVLTRGPVHEAYANATTAQPAPGLFAPKAPPDPIEELPPDQKPAGDNVQWIPGYWAWDEDKADYLWVSGFWRVPPPDRTWVPGAWRDSGNGQWQWTSGFWNMTAQPEVQYLPPPPAPVEAAMPQQPGPDYVYAPGTWVYRETRYVWRPGFWYAFRPGWVYVPAHYSWTPYGHIFVDGYWDYPLRQRGVLFTPVYFGAGVYARPGFVYSPRYVVYDDALYGALFVRPGGGYYFGDYFEPRYATIGYRSWFSVSVSVGARDPYHYDPLFAYYRRTNGPTWALQVNNVYVERTRFPDQRPPRTLVQQTVVVNNITNNTTIVNNNSTNVNNIKNVTMVSSVTNVDKSVVNMTKITPQQQQQAATTARETRTAGVQRAKAEAQMAGPTGRAGPPTAPRTVKLDLPKQPVAAATTSPDKAPPPLPHTPAHPTAPLPTVGTKQPGPVSPVAPPSTTPTRPGTPTAVAPPATTPTRPVTPMPPAQPLQPGAKPPATTPMPPQQPMTPVPAPAGTKPPANNSPPPMPPIRPAPMPPPPSGNPPAKGPPPPAQPPPKSQPAPPPQHPAPPGKTPEKDKPDRP